MMKQIGYTGCNAYSAAMLMSNLILSAKNSVDKKLVIVADDSESIAEHLRRVQFTEPFIIRPYDNEMDRGIEIIKYKRYKESVPTARLYEYDHSPRNPKHWNSKWFMPQKKKKNKRRASNKSRVKNRKHK